MIASKFGGTKLRLAIRFVIYLVSVMMLCLLNAESLSSLSMVVRVKPVRNVPSGRQRFQLEETRHGNRWRVTLPEARVALF